MNKCCCFYLNKNREKELEKHLVLAQEEGQQHQHASVMDDPPHIDVTLGKALAVGREGRDVFGYEQGQVSCSGFSHQLYKEDKAEVELSGCNIFFYNRG